MSALKTFVRRLNFLDMTTPRIMIGVQQVVRDVGKPEMGAAVRWGFALGLTAFWFIEPYDWLRSLREKPEDQKQ